MNNLSNQGLLCKRSLLEGWISMKPQQSDDTWWCWCTVPQNGNFVNGKMMSNHYIFGYTIFFNQTHIQGYVMI